jgi:DNA mismatch endonuclease (patch repair protein)
MSKIRQPSTRRPLKVLAGEPVEPKRSALMARIKGRDSKPEIVVRRLAHRLRYRFRLHRRDLPGTPDMVFPILRKIIFVHGCFWHRHRGCNRTTTPKTRKAFWADKFKSNIERDKVKQRQLKALGWDVLVIWECQTFDLTNLAERLSSFLSDFGIV